MHASMGRGLYMAEGVHGRVRWNYTDDAGHVWAVSVDSYISSQGTPAKIGGTADATSASPARPSAWKKRRVLCYSQTSAHSRMVPLMTATAPLATPGTTITLNVIQPDGTDNEETFVSSGRVLPEGTGKNATRLH